VTADGTTYTINQTYQATTGYRATLEYPVSTSGYRLKLAYDYQNGILQRIRDANGSTNFWTLTSTNPFGQVQNETLGNGVATFTEYDPASGWMLRRQAGVSGGTGLVDAAITWDTAGNLLSRQDLKQSVTETFDYDALNRLTGSQRNGTQNLTLTYNAIGNLLTKSDVGSYTYHATKKRAVIQAGSTVYGYDANGNMTSRGGSSISYTSYNLPSLMNQGSNSSAVSYGAFRNRFKQVTAGSDPTTTIYVAGLLERVTRPGGVTEFRHQIHGPTGTVAIYTRRSSGTADTYYLHRDHLGSPELITNAAGTQVVKPSFAAFGERRGSTWTGTPSSGDWTAIGNVTRRGFTDHEHLDNVGLIHMNGRVYDPRIGRFLSPDPFIDWGLGTQGVNRYGYVGNNPLNRIDPTGALVGGVTGAASGFMTQAVRASGGSGGVASGIAATFAAPIGYTATAFSMGGRATFGAAMFGAASGALGGLVPGAGGAATSAAAGAMAGQGRLGLATLVGAGSAALVYQLIGVARDVHCASECSAY
jgi:RHS repeat-associated protein